MKRGADIHTTNAGGYTLFDGVAYEVTTQTMTNTPGADTVRL